MPASCHHSRRDRSRLLYLSECNCGPQGRTLAYADTNRRRFLREFQCAGLPAFLYRRKSSPLRADREVQPSAPRETSVVKILAWSRHRFLGASRSINKNPVAAILLLWQPRGFLWFSPRDSGPRVISAL